MRLYIGSYGSGISMLDGDRLTGAAPDDAAPAPSFLAVHPTLDTVYAVSEVDGGAAVAFGADGHDGRLRRLGSRQTGGSRPCHLAVSPDGRFLAVANYGDGTVTVLPLDGDGNVGDRTHLERHVGSGPETERQSGPHAHHVSFDGDTLSAVDLGTDTVYDYRLTADGALEQVGEARVSPGSGPRHLVRSDDGFRYIADELTSTVSVYRGYRHIESLSSILAPRDERNYPSEIALSGDGRHLYVANRGNDSLSTFERIDGRLRLVAELPTGGTWPRHFAVVGDRLYVANERSDTVTALPLVDGVPGTAEIVAEVSRPSCVRPARA